MDRGILFVAFGDKYRQEAAASAARLGTLGDWPVHVVSDRTTFDGAEAFDEVIVREPRSAWTDTEFGGDIKPVAFRESPFDTTLFLDSDTFVVDGAAVEELFAAVEEYELAAAHDAARKVEHQYREEPTPTERSPETFPWFNTGVVVYRATDAVQSLLDSWERRYEEFAETVPGVNDQSPFVEAVYESDVSHTVLPPEFNHHVPYPQQVIGPVRLLHGRFDLPRLATELNEVVTPETPYPLQAVHYEVSGGTDGDEFGGDDTGEESQHAKLVRDQVIYG